MFSYGRLVWYTLHVTATHKGYTSKRKVVSLDYDNIKKDLAKGCGCKGGCCEEFDMGIVLRWREKVHLLVAGFEQQQCLYNLYRETIFNDGYGTTQHLVEGHLICR